MTVKYNLVSQYVWFWFVFSHKSIVQIVPVHLLGTDI